MKQAVTARGRRLSPAEGGALEYECPACGARAGVWCRALHSRARRPPRAAELHVARGWASRTCSACGEPPGWPCRTPSGQRAGLPHAARRRLPARPSDLLSQLGPGPRAAHAALCQGGAMTAAALARVLYGPGAQPRRVTNQLVALRRRHLAKADRSTGRWRAIDV